MPDLTTKTQKQLVQDQAAAVQARANGLVDFSVGSILRAFAEANAAVALWLQGLVLILLSAIRASTAEGDDLDSWIADFGGPFVEQGLPTISRLPAQRSRGLLTFSRLTPTGQAVVPVGSIAETQDGLYKFTVVLDPSNPAYNEGYGGYLMLDGTASVVVPAVALTPGVASNAVTGVINTIASALPGIDAVINTADFIGGAEREGDPALRIRFRAYLQALRRATPAAVKFAVTSLQSGMTATLVENEEFDGDEKRGFFYIIVDDGTGDPPQPLMDAAYVAVDNVRAAGVEFALREPSILLANVSVSLVVSSNFATAQALVTTAIQTYLNTRAGDEDVSYSRLYQIVYDATPLVTDANLLTINGATNDLVAARDQVIKAGTVTVS